MQTPLAFPLNMPAEQETHELDFLFAYWPAKQSVQRALPTDAALPEGQSEHMS